MPAADAILRLILATPRPEVLRAFSTAIVSDPEVLLQVVASGTAALDAVRLAAPDLVIIDADLPDYRPFPLIQKLLLVNAMVNTAVVSPLSDGEFHEAGEGLGILGRLPLAPGSREAADLLHKLRQILGRAG